MTNSANPDQLASKKSTDLDLHCLQRQGTSGFSRTRVKTTFEFHFETYRVAVYVINCSSLNNTGMFCSSSGCKLPSR